MTYESAEIVSNGRDVMRLVGTPDRNVWFGGSHIPVTDAPLYLRGAMNSAGEVLAAYVGESNDDAVIVTPWSQERRVGKAVGQHPIGLCALGDGTFYVIVCRSTSWARYHVGADGLDVSPSMDGLPFAEFASTSQGLRDFSPSDGARWMDLDRVWAFRVGDRLMRDRLMRLHLWMARGEWISGQLDKADTGFHDDTVGLWNMREHTLYVPREQQFPTQVQPRLAVNEQGDPILAVSWEPHAVYLTLEQFVPFVAPVPPIGGPGGPDVPRPVPVPPSPGGPMARPLPAAAAQIVSQMFARFLAPLPRPISEDQCRAWAFTLAQQACYSLGPSWGSKKASDGRPQTKDGLAQRTGTLIESWDVLTGAGTGNPSLSNPATWYDISDQVFIPVEPVNHFGLPDTGDPGDEDPPPTGPGPTLPGTDSAKINEILSILQRHFR